MTGGHAQHPSMIGGQAHHRSGRDDAGDPGLDGLLAELATRGVRLSLAGPGQLRVAAPPGTLTPELRAVLAERKPELIGLLGVPAAGSGAVSGAGPGLSLPRATPDPANRHRPFPASDLQTSFLMGSRPGFEYRVRPHQYVEFDLDELDPARFEAALNAAIARQRANIVVAREDLTLAPVTDLTPVRVTVGDLRTLPPAEAQRRMLELRATLERTEPPHDVWPWLFPHISLYATADGGHRARLHYNNNNLFTDARSAFGLVGEALRRCREPGYDPPPPAIAYRECVLALAELEESPAGQRAKAYWLDRIPGWPAAPEVPLRADAALHDRSRLSRRELLFAPATWQALQAQGLARGLGMTSVLLGAYAEVLALWSGSRHFLLNNMVTHRLPLHEDVGEVFGNFASLYPLEVDWRPAEPMAERIRRLQATILADVSNVAYSGVKVLQELNRSRRTLGRAACPYAIGSALFLGPSRRPFHSTLETPQTLVDTEFWELDDGRLWITWDVYEELFPAGLIDAMHDAYRRAVELLANGDDAWEAEALDLTPRAQLAVREQVNAAAGDPASELLHSGLARWAAAEPARIAVRTDDATLSYADLHTRATALAARIAAAGTRPGDIVGVVLPRGWEQVVAVAAVLSAGAAYLPIDPAWPAERLRLLCADAGVNVVLGFPPVAQLLDGAGVTVLPPDDCETPVMDLPVTGTPGDLAYVIYTSGSTGKPKGARLDHRGPATTIEDIRRRFGIGAGDVLFGVSALSFDLSVFDVFGTLAAGATLVLPPDGPADPAGWVRAVREHGVTVWNSVPALAQLLAGEAAAAGTTLPSLRVVLLSGDWIPVDLPDRLRAIAPEAQVVSLGGATEASIWSIVHPIGEVAPEWTSIPYGRPLAHQSWHILDATGRDVPDWVPGELYIGGVGVALGYHHDEERTRAAFVAHPRTGERLYRTGDLGRYLPGGDIELLGRADLQVKISGYRVEPGEIEHALLRCGGVREAAVLARDTAGGKQLVAYVVGDAEVGALRKELAATLPSHLVPARIVVLDALPLTGNGKLDRAALRERATGSRERIEAVAPRTPTETALAAIWREVLDRPALGVHEDFFDLGGTSFAALRVISLTAAVLGRRIPLGTLLERRTVARLARWYDEDGATGPLVRLRDGARPWYFVHPAGGEVLCYRGLAALSGTGFAALQAPPAPDLPGGIEELAARYVAAVRADGPGPYRLGGWSSGGVIAAEMTRQLEAAGAAVEALAVIDVPAPSATRVVDEPTLAAWFAEDVAGLPAGADLAAVRQTFDWVVRACAAYAAPRISAPMVVIRARDGVVPEFADHPGTAAPDWGWAAVTSGAVTAVTLPGTHHTLLTEPHVAAVAETLRPARADEGGSREHA